MSDFLDVYIYRVNHSYGTNVCAFAKIKETNPELYEELAAVLPDRRWRALRYGLQAVGIKMHPTTLSRHADGECQCPTS